MTYPYKRDEPFSNDDWQYFVKNARVDGSIVYYPVKFVTSLEREDGMTIAEYVDEVNKETDNLYTAVAFTVPIVKQYSRLDELKLLWSKDYYIDYEIPQEVTDLQPFLLQNGLIEGEVEAKLPVRKRIQKTSNVKVKGQGFRPDYYGGDENVYEPIKIIQHYRLPFESGIAIKHILRRGNKKGNTLLVDLKKAITYLQFEVDYLIKQQERK